MKNRNCSRKAVVHHREESEVIANCLWIMAATRKDVRVAASHSTEERVRGDLSR